VLSQLAPHRLAIAPEAPVPLSGLLEEVVAAGSTPGMQSPHRGSTGSFDDDVGSPPGRGTAGGADADVDAAVMREVSSLQVGGGGVLCVGALSGRSCTAVCLLQCDLGAGWRAPLWCSPCHKQSPSIVAQGEWRMMLGARLAGSLRAGLMQMWMQLSCGRCLRCR
jgi:hypothetical protein